MAGIRKYPNSKKAPTSTEVGGDQISNISHFAQDAVQKRTSVNGSKGVIEYLSKNLMKTIKLKKILR